MASSKTKDLKMGEPARTRWGELKQTISLFVDLAACFDESGIDIFFLNRGKINAKSATDACFTDAFTKPPAGTTPLTETLMRVVVECGGEKPVLLFMLTDGVPDGGVKPFEEEMRRVVNKQSTQHTFKLQLMACTSDEKSIMWMDHLDKDLPGVDCTDDYFAERDQVLRTRKIEKFTRGDWCLKAMLGPLCQKFDGWDEKSKPGPPGDTRRSS